VPAKAQTGIRCPSGLAEIQMGSDSNLLKVTAEVLNRGITLPMNFSSNLQLFS